MSSNDITSELTEATDPSTLPGRLEELAKIRHRDVLSAVARHPNTPTELLATFCSTMPDEVLQNPAFELLLVEQPSFLSELPARARERLARSEQADVDLLRELGGNTSAEQEVRFAVAANPNTPLEMVREFATQAAVVRAGAARSPNADEALLRTLAVDDEPMVRASVAGNEHTPGDLLKKLARDEAFDVREKAALNQNTPGPELARLATDWGLRIRIFASRNPSTPDEALDLLERALADEHVQFDDRERLRPGLPVDDAIRLAGSEFGEFGSFLAAQHPDLPEEVLEHFAEQPRVQGQRRSLGGAPGAGHKPVDPDAGTSDIGR